MGIRFDLASANWIAHLIDASPSAPPSLEGWEERETLRIFLEKLRDNFYSTRPYIWEFRERLEHASDLLRRAETDRVAAEHLLREIRTFLADRPWSALIVPSGDDQQLDAHLTNERFLQFLVSVRPDDPGLILQLQDMPDGPFSLVNVFPAFKTALAESNSWPGLLIWRRAGDSVFLPFQTRMFNTIEKRARWVFSHLATSLGADLALLKRQYHQEFADAERPATQAMHFIQLSDLHMGSVEASRRIPRVQQLVRNLVAELESTGKVVPLISGDIMDTDDERHFDLARAFIDFLAGLGDAEPLLVLGNHDVRKSGLVLESFKRAIRLPTHSRVVWYDDSKVAIACVNSVTAGKLARGYVGEQQLLDMGNEIDRKNAWDEYSLIGLLHHHPVPVDVPDWYARPFYERILGSAFEKTDALEDADAFMQFAQGRRFAALLHGHKHIPRAHIHRDIAIIGCGSSVGKVSTTDGNPYMSVNVVSVDHNRQHMTARIMGERIPGGGLVEQQRHEIVLRRRLKGRAA